MNLKKIISLYYCFIKKLGIKMWNYLNNLKEIFFLHLFLNTFAGKEIGI